MTDEATLDPAALAHLLEITGDDWTFVDELVDTYLDDAAVQLAALHAAAAADDAAAVVRPAHSLKSGSDSVGATLLTAMCRSLEADGRTGRVADAIARTDAAAREFELVRTELLAARTARD